MAEIEPDLLKNVVGLDLSTSVIEEEEVTGLEFLTNLEYLDLTSCDFDSSIKLLGRSVPRLKRLNISCTDISERLLSSMIRKMRDLEEIDLSYCVNLTVDSIKTIASHCEKLKQIKISGSPKINQIREAIQSTNIKIVEDEDDSDEENNNKALTTTSVSITTSGEWANNTNFDIDDVENSLQWNSGGYPPQWIQFDFGRVRNIAKVVLVPDQYPVTGYSSHIISGIVYIIILNLLDRRKIEKSNGCHCKFGRSNN